MDSSLINVSNDEHVFINEQTNEIHFNGTIGSKSISTLISKLKYLEGKIIVKTKKLKRKILELENDNESNSDIINISVEPKPIKLYITSKGGLVYQVFYAIDTIMSLEVPVHTYCQGLVASAGTLLSLAGKKRYITENSYMLIHEIRSGMWGKFTELTESMENSKQLMDRIKNYYVKKTKLTMEEIDEQLKKDVIWNAQTCLEKGLVDEIIEFK